MGLDLHALADGRAARRHRAAGPLDLHQAHAAGPVGLETRVVAQRGDLDAGGARHLQDGLTRARLDLPPVDGESHRLRPGGLGGGGHQDLLTASKRHFS